MLTYFFTPVSSHGQPSKCGGKSGLFVLLPKGNFIHAQARHRIVVWKPRPDRRAGGGRACCNRLWRAAQRSLYAGHQRPIQVSNEVTALSAAYMVLPPPGTPLSLSGTDLRILRGLFDR